MTQPIPLACDVYDDRPCLVLLHGFPLDRRMWQRQGAALRGVARVLAPDLPGFGASLTVTAPPQLDAWADRVEELLARRLGDEPAVVCGMSMGGYVALRLAARHPQRLRGLVLADSRATADDAAGKQNRDRAIQTVRRQGVQALVEEMLPKLLRPSASQQVKDEVRRLALEQSVPAVVAAQAAMRDRPDSTSVLGTLAVPSLVLVGSEDTLTPVESSQALARVLPNSRLEVIDGAGHLSNLEAPDAFTAALRGFLAIV